MGAVCLSWSLYCYCSFDDVVVEKEEELRERRFAMEMK
jgi:hypothetical protein